jgi:hypothetical protein
MLEPPSIRHGGATARRLREKGAAWRLRVDGGEATIEPLHQDRETLPLPGIRAADGSARDDEGLPEMW